MWQHRLTSEVLNRHKTGSALRPLHLPCSFVIIESFVCRISLEGSPRGQMQARATRWLEAKMRLSTYYFTRTVRTSTFLCLSYHFVLADLRQKQLCDQSSVCRAWIFANFLYKLVFLQVLVLLMLGEIWVSAFVEVPCVCPRNA